MKSFFNLILISALFLMTAACSNQSAAVSSPKSINHSDEKPIQKTEVEQKIIEPNAQVNTPTDIKIVDKPIAWSQNRERLMSEYAKIHYGLDISKIEPKAIVIHWTVTKDSESVYNYFYKEETADPELNEYGKLNVASHFLVDRDGTIFRLTPETAS